MTPKRRKLLLALLACGLLAFAAFIFFRDDPGPSYNGKTLRVWLKSFPDTPIFTSLTEQQIDREAEARHAISQIGTNALPYLVKWIPANTGRSSAQAAAAGIIEKVPALRKISRLSDWATGDAQRDTLRGLSAAFQILGSNAAPAIPDLLKLANTTATNQNEARIAATQSLGLIGLPALPALMSVITNCHHIPARNVAISFVADLGAQASVATPLLIQCLKEDEFGLVLVTITALGRMKTDPDLVIPALTNLLQNPPRFTSVSSNTDTRSALTFRTSYALGRFGSQARDTVPLFIQYLKENPPRDRAAFSVIKNIAPIAPSPDDLIPLLIGYLSHTNADVQKCSVEELAKFGAHSRPALPALTNALQNSSGQLHVTISNAIYQITSASPQAK